MQKKLSMIALCLALVLALMLCGCTTSRTYEFDVETDDTIAITLDTTDGYELKQSDGTFSVNEKGADESVAEGMFLLAEHFETYKELYREQADVFNEGPIDGYPAFYGQVEGEMGTEYNHFILLTDKTAVVIGSLVSQEKADDIIAHLVFDVKEGTRAEASAVTEPAVETAEEETKAGELVIDVGDVAEPEINEELKEALEESGNKSPIDVMVEEAGNKEDVNKQHSDSEVMDRYTISMYNDAPVSEDDPKASAWLDFYVDGTAAMFDGETTEEYEVVDGALYDGENTYVYTMSDDGNKVVVNLGWDDIFVFEK